MVKRLIIDKADRLYRLPAAIDEFLPAKGKKPLLHRDVIDLAQLQWPTGSPSGSESVIPRPAPTSEISQLAELTAVWYQTTYGVHIHPEKEIFIGGGIRQLLALVALSFFNTGELVLIPDPGVWHYRAAVAISSAESVPYHLVERNQFKPAVRSLAGDLIRAAKGMILNAPHNPTGSTLQREELEELARLAGRHNLILLLDQAFSGLTKPEFRTSLFGVPGGRKVGLEMYSYAYNFGLPLPSHGFIVAQPALISGLRQTAKVFGIGLTKQEIEIASAACQSPPEVLESLSAGLARNRELADQFCHRLGLTPVDSQSGPFLWARLPGRKQSRRFCRVLYLKSGILAVPGAAFGENGEGYIRLALLSSAESWQRGIEAAANFSLAIRRRQTDG